MFTPESDVTEPYSDGSGVKILFPAGIPIAWQTALELGLVTGEPPTAPTPRKRPNANTHD